jgi:hypothetical protein
MEVWHEESMSYQCGRDFYLQANDDRKKVAAAITQRWVIRDDNIGGPSPGPKREKGRLPEETA